jgi:hypothetical protein
LPHEKRELIGDIQVDTFRHMKVEEVRWVTSWALTLAAASDETVVRVWSEIHGGR